jgi:F0F1-type ATP synthase membrane subunit c/vacuolar-type H+-ATPase subunit K
MGAIPAEPREALRTAAIISAAMITSVVMYGVVVNFFRLTGSGPFEGFVRLPQILAVRAAVWVMAAVALAAIPFVRRALLARAPNEDARTVVGRLAVSSLVTNALAEVPALLGFVLVALNGLYLDFYALAAISILQMLVYFPRYEAWEEWLNQRP